MTQTESDSVFQQSQQHIVESERSAPPGCSNEEKVKIFFRQIKELKQKLKKANRAIKTGRLTRQKLDNQLKGAEKRICLMLNEMICGYALHEIICDTNGKPEDYRFIDANPAFEKLIGLKLERIIGKTARDVLPGIETHWIEKYGQVALTGQPIRFESYSLDLDKYFDVAAFSPEIGRFAVIFNDISTQKKAEQSIQESSEKIKLFAYSISHDLKNPSVALGGISNLLLKKYGHKLGAKGKECCDMIHRASTQLVSLVDQINYFIEANEAPLSFTEFSLKDVLLCIKEEFSEKLEKGGIKWQEPKNLPRIYADKLSIIRCLRNLVDNAIKYGSEELSRITFEHEETPKFHTLCVKDDGRGISGNACSTIFDTFKREQNAQETGGTGLGLAIVKELAERHNGSVWAESCSPKGSVFCFTISKQLT